MEKDFYCPAFVNANGETVFYNSYKKNSECIARDAVDSIIERVLENGGDVEFVEELDEYQHIALVEYNFDDQ